MCDFYNDLHHFIILPHIAHMLELHLYQMELAPNKLASFTANDQIMA
jgi:hypothetical protein